MRNNKKTDSGGISLCKSNSKSQPTSTNYQFCNSGDSNIYNERICMEAANELNLRWGNSVITVMNIKKDA